MILNYVDLTLIAVIVLSVVRGWQRGFVIGLLDLIGWLGGLVLALRLYGPVANWLGSRLGWADVWSRPVAFLVVAVGTSVVINVLGSVVLRRVPRHVHQQPNNRVLGIVPGLINGVIGAAIVAAILLIVPLPSSVRANVRDSGIAHRLAAGTERFEAVLRPVFGAAIEHTLTSLRVPPESDERVDLQFTVTNGVPAPDLEAQMLDLINRERVAAGIAPLTFDPDLVPVARAHSQDMLRRGYFAHATPEGVSPFDRIEQAGVPYFTAGENLALAPTLELAHTGLMNSPGHRANILRPEFGRVGIGIIDANMRGLMITQNFRD